MKTRSGRRIIRPNTCSPNRGSIPGGTSRRIHQTDSSRQRSDRLRAPSAHGRAITRLDYLFTCFGEALPRSASSRCAAAGGATLPSRTISLALSSFPYRALLAPSSDRSVEPSSDTPANSPCALEYDRISAFITISVAAAASRPTGPAATDASPPSFTLLDITEFAPDSFITSSTKSVACPPIWKPKLPASSANIAGALHGPEKSRPLRHVINPRP